VAHGGHLALDTAKVAAVVPPQVVKGRSLLDILQALRKALEARLPLLVDIIITPLQVLEHLQRRG
jgi:thiamine pyrophosphate-dependent acetolactate synthase large subunit-like protein